MLNTSMQKVRPTEPREKMRRPAGPKKKLIFRFEDAFASSTVGKIPPGTAPHQTLCPPGSFIRILQAAPFGNEHIITVRLADLDPTEHGDHLVFVPRAPLCDHIQLAADFQSVKTLFNKTLCHRKIRLIRRIGQDEIEAAGIHALETVRDADVHPAHTVPLRIPPRGCHRHRIGIGHENIFFPGDLRCHDADNAASTAKIHNAHTRRNLYMRKHRERAAIHVLRRKQTPPRLQRDLLAQDLHLKQFESAFIRHAYASATFRQVIRLSFIITHSGTKKKKNSRQFGKNVFTIVEKV